VGCRLIAPPALPALLFKNLFERSVICLAPELKRTAPPESVEELFEKVVLVIVALQLIRNAPRMVLLWNVLPSIVTCWQLLSMLASPFENVLLPVMLTVPLAKIGMPPAL
jgi:hypothetical protein